MDIKALITSPLVEPMQGKMSGTQPNITRLRESAAIITKSNISWGPFAFSLHSLSNHLTNREVCTQKSHWNTGRTKFAEACHQGNCLSVTLYVKLWAQTFITSIRDYESLCFYIGMFKWNICCGTGLGQNKNRLYLN